MKLLFLIGSMAPDSGGPAREVAWLTESIVGQAGLLVTVACPTPHNQSLPLHPDVHYFQFDNPIFPQPSWLRAVGDLKKLISEHDLLFITGIWGPIDGFALRLAWQPHKPVYLRVCGMLEPYILARHPLKKQLGRLLYLQKNLRQATGIIVNSESEAYNVQQVGVAPEKILVIPNGMRLTSMPPRQQEAKSSLGINVRQPVLLYLGRLHPKKGLHILLQAMALLPVHKRGFSLLVAGECNDEKYQAQIMEIVQSGGLQTMVRFSGLVTGTDKECHFQAADAFILPSVSEGLPNAVLEAMAYGLPVIVTKGCNLPEVATYGAGLVVELSVSNLSRALEWFLTGGAPLASASSAARQLMRDRFSPEQSIYQYKQILAKYTLHSDEM